MNPTTPAKYTVVKEGASLMQMKFHAGGSWSFYPHKLHVGDVIVANGFRDYDGAQIPLFKMASGAFSGEFEPTCYGSIPKGFLEPYNG